MLIAPTNFMLLKTFNSEFLYIELLFTDQISQPLEIEDRITLTLDPKNVKGCEFLSLAKNIAKHLSSKYSQKLLDSAKESEIIKVDTWCNKTCFKTAIQNTAEATGDLIGNKISDKINKISHKVVNKLNLIKKYLKKDTYLQ